MIYKSFKIETDSELTRGKMIAAAIERVKKGESVILKAELPCTFAADIEPSVTLFLAPLHKDYTKSSPLKNEVYVRVEDSEEGDHMVVFDKEIKTTSEAIALFFIKVAQVEALFDVELEVWD